MSIEQKVLATVIVAYLSMGGYIWFCYLIWYRN